MVLAPAFFCAHGSPMNMLRDSSYTESMKMLRRKLCVPTSIIIISAHWVTQGIKISSAPFPSTIHDFQGFPKELYEIQYPAPGNIELSNRIYHLLLDLGARKDYNRGFDHGVWGILKFLFPDAQIPVVQISINKNYTPEEHVALARRLLALRKENIMIIGSGDIVHNLWKIESLHAHPTDWALRFDDFVVDCFQKHDISSLIHFYKNIDARLACPTDEHYIPLLYIAAITETEPIEIFYKGFEHATISLTSLGSISKYV